MSYRSAYIRSDSFHLFTCVCGKGNGGRNIRAVNRTASVPVWETYCRHINVLDERSFRLSPLHTWDVPAFWCLFWCSDFFLCSLCSPCVWVEIYANEERQENMGFEEEIKYLKINHFLEFRCLWNFKRNEKGHIFGVEVFLLRCSPSTHTRCPISRFPLG